MDDDTLLLFRQQCTLFFSSGENAFSTGPNDQCLTPCHDQNGPNPTLLDVILLNRTPGYRIHTRSLTSWVFPWKMMGLEDEFVGFWGKRSWNSSGANFACCWKKLPRGFVVADGQPFAKKFGFHPRNLTVRPWKMMVGRGVSFWGPAYF